MVSGGFVDIRWELCAQSCVYVCRVRVRVEGMCIGSVCGYGVLEEDGASVQLK